MPLEDQTGYLLPEIDYNVMNDGRNVFISRLKRSKNIWLITSKTIIATSQEDGCLIACPLDSPYFKENYMLHAIDLSKQKALDADPEAIQFINFTGNIDPGRNTTMFSIIEEANRTNWYFSPRAVWVL